MLNNVFTSLKRRHPTHNDYVEVIKARDSREGSVFLLTVHYLLPQTLEWCVRERSGVDVIIVRGIFHCDAAFNALSTAATKSA